MADRYGNYGNQDVESWRRIPTRDEPRMEAEPPLWKKITTSVMHDPLPSPVPAGLVMRGPTAVANAAKVADLAERRIGITGQDMPDAYKAVQYLASKYPKLMSKVGVWTRSPEFL